MGNQSKAKELLSTQQSILKRRGLCLEYLTVTWCVIEGAVAILAGVKAHSLALMAFGLDSGIEVFAGLVLVWQLQNDSEMTEHTAARLIAISFFLLALYLIARSIWNLALEAKPEESITGIVISALAIIIMPLLAVAKRRTGQQLGNAALVSESNETLLCSLLAGATLIALILNAALKWWWVDPLAAIFIALWALKEGVESWRGDDVD